MIGIKKKILLVSLLVLSASGCAKLAPQEAFYDVAYDVGERINKRIQWDAGTGDDMAARAAVKGMLARKLTPASAVQIALLNNRGLQASYAEVGIAQANLVVVQKIAGQTGVTLTGMPTLPRGPQPVRRSRRLPGCSSLFFLLMIVLFMGGMGGGRRRGMGGWLFWPMLFGGFGGGGGGGFSGGGAGGGW